MKKNIKYEQRQKRRYRIRKKVVGTPEQPRLSIYKSLKGIYVQLIDDLKGATLLSVSTSSKSFKDTKKISENKKDVATAKLLGQYLGELALRNNIKKFVFDRSGYKYHGRVKAVAEGAREAGVLF